MIVEFTIRMTHTDAAGIVYFVSFLDLAHQAYETVMESLGVPLSQDLRALAVMLPIVHVDCDYAAPLRLGERVRIDATLARLGERSFTMAYTFDREDGQRCGRATTVHASVSNQTGRAVPVPREIRRALERLDRG